MVLFIQISWSFYLSAECAHDQKFKHHLKSLKILSRKSSEIEYMSDVLMLVCFDLTFSVSEKKLRKFMFASSFHNNVGYFFKINCFTPGHSLLIKIGFRIIVRGYSVTPHRPQEKFHGDGVIKIDVTILILMPIRIFQIIWKERNLIWWSANISCFFKLLHKWFMLIFHRVLF